MKVGIIGNMNNMYFSLTRYLLDLGYDCDQLIFDYEPAHFHPSSDSYDGKLISHCKELSWGDPGRFLHVDFKQVKKDLEPYSFLIGSGPAPAFVKRIGRTLDIFIPYGDDLYSLPFFRIVHPIRTPAYLAVAYYQMKGIRETPYIVFDKTNERFEKIFSKLRYQGIRIFSPPPLLYHKEYTLEKMINDEKDNPHLMKMRKLRVENDLVIVQHIRQLWKKHSDIWSNKGNDKLIKGFAAFIKMHPGVKATLILFEYGTDVRHTKQLIDQLGIQDYVVWFSKMPRKHIMYIIQNSDMVVGELIHSWLTYCVVFEALCMSKPLMHKRIDRDFIEEYPSLYPMVYADSKETVLEGLKNLLKKKEELIQLGIKGKEWFLHYGVKKPIEHIVHIIKKKSGVGLFISECYSLL
ncbi:MAG: hypothetical protein M3352_12230 [Bacteroidota bacterium]|nr:hypothetical protein [Bacteroidota bacterium]